MARCRGVGLRQPHGGQHAQGLAFERGVAQGLELLRCFFGPGSGGGRGQRQASHCLTQQGQRHQVAAPGLARGLQCGISRLHRCGQGFLARLHMGQGAQCLGAVGRRAAAFGQGQHLGRSGLGRVELYLRKTGIDTLRQFCHRRRG